MTIMTISIPENVKEAFDKAFEGEDKGAIIAELIRAALQEKGAAPPPSPDAPKPGLVAEFRKLRESMPPITDAEIRQAHEELRREAGY